jgi:hypothetical protein
MLPNKKRSRFEDDSTLLFISTSGGILPTRFESFEILIKACCPFPGTMLDFRFIHDPEGIAQPYALAKIAGGKFNKLCQFLINSAKDFLFFFIFIENK